MMTRFERFVWEAKRRWRNWRLGNPREISIYLDDERPCPYAGWYHAATAEEALNILRFRRVTHLDLDHDLGDGKMTGYQLVYYLAERSEDYYGPSNYWPTHRPTIHSDNPVGRANMESVINRYGPYPKVRHLFLVADEEEE